MNRYLPGASILGAALAVVVVALPAEVNFGPKASPLATPAATQQQLGLTFDLGVAFDPGLAVHIGVPPAVHEDEPHPGWGDP